MRSGIMGGFNIWIYGKGLMRGYIVSLALFLIGAILITYTGLGENVIPILTSIIMIVSIAYAAIYVVVHTKKKGWLHGGLVGILYIFILILLSKAFVTGYMLDRVVYYRIIISMITGMIGGMIGINMK
ncbi:hypothetical protein CACET_c17280 [Clostridium aceticum]|uniref:Uncharacterized protein n=1 Tax=Clostridium aceticum TaxID=84022 RepID=A0A0D8ID82_9CLOT|nr:TIGR04086 family membrane protein [Clostridium aceticum]AKL95176.1 hypothetical protein CACET_c17280 [Clostridium aceticum]KJF28049.1 hypothetical protein TZ02_05680 [Clostridium aceticum]